MKRLVAPSSPGAPVVSEDNACAECEERVATEFLESGEELCAPCYIARMEKMLERDGTPHDFTELRESLAGVVKMLRAMPESQGRTDLADTIARQAEWLRAYPLYSRPAASPPAGTGGEREGCDHQWTGSTAAPGAASCIKCGVVSFPPDAVCPKCYACPKHRDPAPASRSGGPRAECRWTDDGDGNWATECDHLFTFNDGPPSENEARFCCYCGGSLVEVPYRREPEEDDDAH